MSRITQDIVVLLALASLLPFFAEPAIPTGAAPVTRDITAPASLPQAARLLVSATLGRDNAAYHFQSTAEGYRVASASNTLRADFSKAGMRLSAGNSHWMFALRGIGYGDALQSADTVAPAASANRLEYTHGDFIEWYVNGPAGLEQSWTLTSRPPAHNSDALTLALALEGSARVDASGSSIALLRDDGSVALNYAGLSAYDVTGRQLHAWLELDRGEAASSLRIRVDDTRAEYPVTIDPYILTAALTNATAGSGDSLGWSVAMSADGSTIVAGAFGVNNIAGAAYVFVKSGRWVPTGTPTAVLTYSGGVSYDSMGWSVAISGDGSTIVASAVGASNYRGAMYVFVRPGGGWATTSTPAAALTNSGGASDDRLGFSVAINGDGSTIAAGAPWVNGRRGAAYVYVKPGGGWAGSIISPTAALTNSIGNTYDELGFSVAMSADGSTIDAGAPYGNGNKGAAYVFVKSGSWATTGTPDATLTNAGGVSADLLGWSVAMSADGSTLVAGAEGVNSYTGAACVFVKPGGGWATTSAPAATLTNSSGAHLDDLGYSVAINSDGSTIAAGAPGRVSNSIAAGYVFVKSGTWVTTAKPTAALLDIYAVGATDPGHSLAMDANGLTVVAGDNEKNAVYVLPWFPPQLFWPTVGK